MSVDGIGGTNAADGVAPDEPAGSGDASEAGAPPPAPPAAPRDSAGPFAFLRVPPAKLETAGHDTRDDRSHAEHTKTSFSRGASTERHHDRSVSARGTPEGGRDPGAIAGDARTHVTGGKKLVERRVHGEADATALHARGGVETQGRAGTLRAGYDARALQAHAEATADATLTTRGLDATADARANVTLVDASATVSYTTPPATVEGVPFNGQVDATVHATVSAEAHATGEVVIDPTGGRVYAGGDVGASAVAKIDASGTAAAQFTDDEGQSRTIASVTGEPTRPRAPRRRPTRASATTTGR